MLGLILRAAATSPAAAKSQPAVSDVLIPAIASLSQHLSSSRAFSASAAKQSLPKGKKGTQKGFEAPGGSLEAETINRINDGARLRALAEDEKDASLDVGPNLQPLFTSAASLSQLSKKDTCTYMKFSIEELEAVLPEGLPKGMLNEFEDSKRNALLIRQSFLDLRDNFRRIVDPTIQTSVKGSKPRKQIVLDGPVSCGKSIALAMLVHWAREEGWLVFYVPRGREWTHGGFFYKNLTNALWDTPAHAANILKDFLKYNEQHLQKLPCKIFDPIPLGEGVGVGPPKGDQTMTIPEGLSLFDLVERGLSSTYASVGVVVRLRQELSLVKDMPVLIAVDQYNSWFTFSEYQEPATVRSCRPIHARELTTVNAFRSMFHDDMMVGAFSHSTAVGKLRQDLPDVPADARLNYPRYSLDEAAVVCYYYLRQRLIRRESFSEENWKKIYYLSNGNGAEMRWLVPFMR
ncbi:unnamed protein product [Cuscuta campestris]|uniref:Small ribosomal subunit protein mS29 n=2 Tax=Cuscuta sect. Cleistogrammica TaxID=1824901 RepID=A0A484LV58_9ASTE|nr:hypothetical protein DM860_008213 [Cuscuta australis]VFQ80194.1 unnamed protein product [Cuscuta campestris]